MRNSLTAIGLSVVLACVLAVAPAAATASGVSKVTISQLSPTWHGMVMSKRFGGSRSCEQGRLVKVYEKRDGKDQLIGRDTSSKKGHWAVPDKPTKGTYYAKLVARPPAGEKPACQGDLSSGVEVG